MIRKNTKRMGRWERVFFKTGLSFCSPQFIPWSENILSNPSQGSTFTDFVTCTPNTLQMSSTLTRSLLLSLAFLVFSTLGKMYDHQLGQWRQKDEKVTSGDIRKQDLQMTVYKVMPPAFCIFCRREKMKFWSGDKSGNKWNFDRATNQQRPKTHCTEQLPVDPPSWPDSLGFSSRTSIFESFKYHDVTWTANY